MNKWMLPESLSDELPVEARRTEEIRRKLLDLYRSYGFELVSPPLIEYIESLLSGGGNDLDLRTCKLIDQISGRTLGVRADMTPQVSRIDAHLLNRTGVTRLCYCGSVLHARPAGLFSSRELLQIGAEIYGHEGIEADLEIIHIVLETMHFVEIENYRLDLCHLGVVHGILESDQIAEQHSNAIISFLREKNIPSLRNLMENIGTLRENTVQALSLLPSLHGGLEVIDKAFNILPKLPGVTQSLENLKKLAKSIIPQVNLGIDLADVGGYGYHSGVTFALYVDGLHDALVTGGRYDNVGLVFGKSRMATGFSLDLRRLATFMHKPMEKVSAICVHWCEDPALFWIINQLRRKGEIVIQILPGHKLDQWEFSCDRELILSHGEWIVKKIHSSN